MKITRRHLKRIIAEEKSKLIRQGLISEASGDRHEETDFIMDEVRDIVESHMDSLFREIQDLLGVTTGDVAGQHWANMEDQFMQSIRHYVDSELMDKEEGY